VFNGKSICGIANFEDSGSRKNGIAIDASSSCLFGDGVSQDSSVDFFDVDLFVDLLIG